MSEIAFGQNVFVAESEKNGGRGVFANWSISKNLIFEICPVILIPYANQQARESYSPTQNVLDNYYFSWNKKYWCAPTGFAMLYNHSYAPNAIYLRDFRNKTLKFVATEKIEKDHEILINYNGDPNNKTPIETWFKEVNGKKIV